MAQLTAKPPDSTLLFHPEGNLPGCQDKMEEKNATDHWATHVSSRNAAKAFITPAPKLTLATKIM